MYFVLTWTQREHREPVFKSHHVRVLLQILINRELCPRQPEQGNTDLQDS